MNTPPDFRSPDFLRRHILHTMSFYDPRSLDESGGFFHFYKDDGTVYDRQTRHLVSSTRFVFNNAMAARRFGNARWRDAARHGIRFLREVHRDPQTGGYAWLLRWNNGQREIVDATNHCYGLAFVLLAHAHAAMAGVSEARAGISETFELMEAHFWEPAHGLYADEATPDWTVAAYRGQNANMHACEAMLAAFDATRDRRYLDRAETLAESVTRRQASLAGGLIWEHYRLTAQGDWTPDWDYNRDDRSNIFRPWGYQPGHFTEWAKLLCQLDRIQPQPWRLPHARELFDRAWRSAWDTQHGGLHYGTAPDGSVCDADKYHWVQAESLAAAALLALASDDAGQRDHDWQRYEQLWSYCWHHFVDHRDGAWFRILTRDNLNLTREKSPAGKVDYHDIGACYDVWRALSSPASAPR